MSSPWIDFIDNLKDDAATLAKDELKGLVANALQDGDAFIRKQAAKAEQYLNQLAEGMITRDQFEGYMQDLADLTKMQALKLKVDAKARAQRLANGIENLILDKLLKLLP